MAVANTLSTSVRTTTRTMRVDRMTPGAVVNLTFSSPPNFDCSTVFHTDETTVTGGTLLVIGSTPALARGLAWSVDTTSVDGSVFLTVVPEPASSALIATGVLVLLLRRRRAA